MKNRTSAPATTAIERGHVFPARLLPIVRALCAVACRSCLPLVSAVAVTLGLVVLHLHVGRLRPSRR